MPMPVITIVILVFAGIVMLVLAHVCMVEWIFRRGLRNNGNNNNNNTNGAASVNRNSRGNTSMPKDEVEKLPCFDFISKENGSSPLNCAVCLENVKVGEKCRLLPVCKHSFHTECVDSWLLKMPSCPICRTRADSGRSGLGEGSSGHFSDFSLSNMESQATESSRFSDTRSELREDPSQPIDGVTTEISLSDYSIVTLHIS